MRITAKSQADASCPLPISCLLSLRYALCPMPVRQSLGAAGRYAILQTGRSLTFWDGQVNYRIMSEKEKILEAAQKYILKGQAKKAIKEYLRLIEASPKDKRLYLKLGDLYLKEGEYEKAIKEYLKLAELYTEEDLNFRAISVYKKVLSIDPKLVEPLSKLAGLYLKEGLAGSAKTYYQNILDINPDDHEALEALRNIENPPPSAKRSLFSSPLDRSGIPISPGAEVQGLDKDVETHYHLGIAYKEMELFDYAISEFEMASSDEAMKFDCYIMLGSCFKEKGDYQKAIEYYKMATGTKGLPPDKLARVHFDLGVAYEDNGMISDALETFEEVLKLDHSFSEARKRVKKLQTPK